MRAAALLLIAIAGATGACVPSLPPPTPVPAGTMELDLTSVPPTAPQPTSLVVNPVTGHIDFAQAGIQLPADCLNQNPVTFSPAECEFDKYLESLDGFPTVTPATAPASGPLDMATVTDTNVVAVAAKAMNPVSGLMTTFNTSNNTIVTRLQHWTIGEFYWLSVRGYANGVHTPGGGEVVASPTTALLKSDSSLTCGATTPDTVSQTCSPFTVIKGTGVMNPEMAALMLEQIRVAYAPGFKDIADWANVPKSENAVLWGFPIHSNSVAELDPTVGLVPMPKADGIHVAVQGPVDPATVKAFVLQMQAGSVVVIDLTTLANTQNPDPTMRSALPDAFPTVTATYANGDIVITPSQPFTPGHQIGLFFTNGIKSPATATAPQGAPLVPSPVSKLLTLQSPLVDAQGKSTISTVSSADAQMLEAGRMQLASLFDNALLGQLTGISRDNLVYTFAFPIPGAAQ